MTRTVSERIDRTPRRGSTASAVLGIIAEILITLAAILALYIAWQLWWTGAEAEAAQADQRNATSWSDPAQGKDGYRIAAKQTSTPPVQPQSAKTGDLIAQLYVPRFGQTWHRNVVEGTDAYQLSRHGLGHYPQSQMPGQLGNVAIAGHRSGYGEPLAHVDTLQSGDKIIIRTKDYWYVYTYTDYKIVTPDHTEVVAAVPNEPGATPTERYVTLTTCEPRYTTATHRWISYGKFEYWAKVSEGIPQELATTGSSGTVEFTQNADESLESRIAASLVNIIVALAIAYVAIYGSALIAWRYPALRAIRFGHRRASASLYGWLIRLQPGPVAIRCILILILAAVLIGCLFEWGFPWAASNIPYLKVTSNFVAVE
ncbi:sortase [Bifidobacterium margollesii]|uniref:Sortase n=1 Tax=Bifidobacterium margollesii TaxID=2020964 RepID=A0A2N5JAB5_9BIFI|nr:class E sortase [Bifidobacterium margollesii]PLS31139.1 sortase [Bifidobacterium margollesii]